MDAILARAVGIRVERPGRDDRATQVHLDQGFGFPDIMLDRPDLIVTHKTAALPGEEGE